MNLATLCGNVGQDPEIRHTQDGKPIANFSLATSEQWRDKNTNERKEKTEWHRVVSFNENISKVIEQYVKKGSKILMTGVIRTRKYTDKEGTERYATEIVIEQFKGHLELLGSPGGKSPGFSDDPEAYGKTTTRAPADQGQGEIEGRTVHNFKRDLDDQIPF